MESNPGQAPGAWSMGGFPKFSTYVCHGRKPHVISQRQLGEPPVNVPPMQKVSLFSIKSLPSVSLIVNKTEVRSEFILKKKRAKLKNQAPKEAPSFFPLPSPGAKNAGNPGFIFLQLNLVMMSCVWLSRAVF